MGRARPRSRDRAGGVDQRRAHARVDESRIAGEDRRDRGGALLVALAPPPVADRRADRLRIVGETADLWFHCLIMLAQYGLRPADVLAELRRREGISGIDEKAARAEDSRAKAERK